MSRMGEWFAETQEDRDAEEAARYQYEQELLQRDPAFRAWLDKLDAETRPQPEQEPQHDRHQQPLF